MSHDPFSNPELAPLAAAVARDDAAEIRRQLERIPADTPGSDGSTLLLAAVSHGRLAAAQALLDGGADPNRPDARGDTAVHAAAFADDPALLAAVLAHGGDPDIANDQTGARPLFSALRGGNPAQLRMLLDAGADPDLADRNRNTALHVAARTNNGAGLLLLLESGATATAANSGGASFQAYYFAFPRNALNARALDERRQVIAWLKAHQVPLEAVVGDPY